MRLDIHRAYAPGTDEQVPLVFQYTRQWVSTGSLASDSTALPRLPRSERSTHREVAISLRASFWSWAEQNAILKESTAT